MRQTDVPARQGFDHARPMELSANLRVVVSWLVAAFVFSIPTEYLVNIPGLGTVTRIVGLVTAPLALVALIDRGRIRVRAPSLFLLAAAAFALWNVVSVFWSRSPSATLSAGFTLAQLLVFVWLIGEFCRGPVALARLMQAFVLGNYAALGIAVALLLQATGVARDTGRDPNTFATVLAWGIPLAVWLVARGGSRRLYLVNLAYPVFVVLGVVLSASRGGLLVTLVALLAIPFMVAQLGLLKRVALAVVLSVGVLVTFIAVPQWFPQLQANLERLGETSEELTEGTLTGRTLIWAETMRIIDSSPIVGVGARAARQIYADTILGRERVAHNSFLQVASETGLIGVLLFLGIIVSAAAGLLGMDRTVRPYAVILLAALITGMGPLTLDSEKSTWFVLALLANQAPIMIAVARPPWSLRVGSMRRERHGAPWDSDTA